MTAVLAVLLCVLALVSTVLGYIAMASGIQCLGNSATHLCSEKGWGAAVWLPMAGGPVAALSCVIAMSLASKRKYIWGFVGITAVLALWLVTDVITHGWVLRSWW
ncbi:hypothetical protein ACWEWX_45905 [Streptomyces asiaticus]